MGAAGIGRVGQVNLAGLHAIADGREQRLYARSHRTQVHRNVGSIRDEVTAPVKDRAGKIKPLLDIHRMGRILQRKAHLFGNGHECLAEDLEHHRINRVRRPRS